MAGISSFGTLFKIGDGAGTEAFTTVADVHDISGPTLSMGTEDVTSHSSPSGWAEYCATVGDGGEVTFSINYNPTAATHNATNGLLADMAARTLRHFKLVFSNTGATTWNITAIVTKFEPKAPVKGKLTADVGVKITGLPSLV
jgi:hypothetical protein